MKKNIFSNQQIGDYLNTSYGIKHAQVSPLSIGADMNASVYKATANDKTYFIKVKNNKHLDSSASIIEMLHDSGIQNIIPLIKTKDGKRNLCVGDYTITISEFIEGKDGFNCELTNDQWITFGKVMRQIHEIEIPPSCKSLIRRENFSPKWRDAIRQLYANINSLPIMDDVSLKFIAFLKEHAAVIHQLVDRAEQLGKQIQAALPEFVLCHSDIHGGNVLVEQNGKIYIVDWDAPILAPKERDLMFIGGGVANVWNKPHELDMFYKGYGETKVDTILLAYYRQERIVEDISEYSQIFLQANERNLNLAKAYKHFIDQFEPRGVVEIAIETDKRLN